MTAVIFLALGVDTLNPQPPAELIELQGLPQLTRDAALPPGTRAYATGNVDAAPVGQSGFVIYIRERLDLLPGEDGNDEDDYAWRTVDWQSAPLLTVRSPSGDVNVRAVPPFYPQGADTVKQAVGNQQGRYRDVGIPAGALITVVGTVETDGALHFRDLRTGTRENWLEWEMLGVNVFREFGWFLVINGVILLLMSVKDVVRRLRSAI